MISISQWGCFDDPYGDIWERKDWTLVDVQERRKQLTANLASSPSETKMPAWWAGSAAYQNLNFGPYLT